MKKLLHVGCGLVTQQHLRGFSSPTVWQEIRLDIDAAVKPDVVGTITDMSAVDSASIDAVFSAHNLEHIHPFEVLGALGEFLRVLKPDGFAIVTCPDLQSVCEVVARDLLMDPLYISPAGPIRPIDILYGHQHAIQQGNSFMTHKGGFTGRTLGSALMAAGFASVYAIRRDWSLWALATKDAREQDDLALLAERFFPPAATV